LDYYTTTNMVWFSNIMHE